VISLFTPISSNNNNDHHDLIDIFLRQTFNSNEYNYIPVQFRIGSAEVVTILYSFPVEQNNIGFLPQSSATMLKLASYVPE
jgi:hypothetical protein